MTTLKEFLLAASKLGEGGPLSEVLETEMNLGTLGPYPLSIMTSLAGAAPQVPFQSGEIRIVFEDVSLRAVQVIGVTSSGDNDAGKLTVQLAPMRLHGNYTVTAVRQPRVEIDTGGNLVALRVTGDTPTISEKLYDQLNQANDQKAQLRRTPAGQQLLANYNTYNDTYNTLFQTNAALQKYWQNGGGTSSMADRTSQGVTDGTTIINDPSLRYGPHNYTYNQNAGQQAAFLMAACYAKKYYEAGTAVASFRGQVIHGVGTVSGQPATLDSLNTVTAPAVCQVVNGNPQFNSGIEARAEHAKSVFSAVQRIASSTHTDDDVSLFNATLTELNDHLLKGMQEIYAEGLRQELPAHQAVLWQGRISCLIPESTFTFSLVDHHQGAIATTLLKQNLTCQKLKVDDENWSGEAGEIAKKRVNSALFIHGLISSRFSNRFEHKLAQHVTANVATAKGN